jgi:hypothetical protein
MMLAAWLREQAQFIVTFAEEDSESEMSLALKSLADIVRAASHDRQFVLQLSKDISRQGLKVSQATIAFRSSTKSPESDELWLTLCKEQYALFILIAEAYRFTYGLSLLVPHLVDTTQGTNTAVPLVESRKQERQRWLG